MKKYYTIILITIIIGMIIYAYKHNYSSPSDLSNYVILNKTVEGNSMYPLIRSGDNINLIVDYYAYNPPLVGDIVGYNYGGNRHMLIKVLRATHDDRVEIVSDGIMINGVIMNNSGGKVYRFGDGELNMLKMYIKNGKIPKDSYLIFGDNVLDSVDSRKFGAIGKSDLLGKFIYP